MAQKMPKGRETEADSGHVIGLANGEEMTEI
jgi:hypothetical protein